MLDPSGGRLRSPRNARKHQKEELSKRRNILYKKALSLLIGRDRLITLSYAEPSVVRLLVYG